VLRACASKEVVKTDPPDEIDALERRDPKGAAAEMFAHIREWQAYFVNRFNH